LSLILHGCLGQYSHGSRGEHMREVDVIYVWYVYIYLFSDKLDFL
jgi:hypothetical protein